MREVQSLLKNDIFGNQTKEEESGQIYEDRGDMTDFVFGDNEESKEETKFVEQVYSKKNKIRKTLM